MASSSRMALNPNFSQCTICLEDFKQPKFFECFHTFCKECIRDLEKKSPGTVSCPLCQRKVLIPAGGVEQLTSNFYILNLNTNKPEDGLQTVKSDRIQNVSSETDSNRKTVDVEYDGTHFIDGVEAEFDGIVFLLNLPFHVFHQFRDAVGLNIKISIPSSPFIESCDIDYDISLVNQKDREFSVNKTGNRKVAQRILSDSIPFVNTHEALNVHYGFIVKERTDKTGKKIQTFQLDVDIKVSNKKKKCFSV